MYFRGAKIALAEGCAMGYKKEFEEIRPFWDQEVPEVVDRLVHHPGFYTLMNYVHPDWSEEQVREKVLHVGTVADFQSNIAHPGMRLVTDRTIENLTVSGLENIKKGETYLFISNHRDIILDSAILNIILFEAGHGTIQTAIGSNLLTSDLVSDLTRLNKNFVVKRNTGAREFYENSMLLSAYIRHMIADRQSSIWIAQREGRTKDGLDKTQPGLLKMLSIACDKTLRECFRELRVTPVAISYEYDPCDVLKIPELKAISREEKYEKTDDEDYHSILTGLTGNKGRVHISIGKTIDKELDTLADFPNVNDKLRILGDLLDQQIYQNYKLWPTNRLALDILDGNIQTASDYDGLDPDVFVKRMKERLHEANLKQEEDYNWLLNMYANPVRNFMACEI